MSSVTHVEDHAHAHAEGHAGHHGFSHPMAVWKLLAVFFALVFLTWVTVYQSTLDTGNAEIWLSLFIATIKAALVILFFMHMIHEKPFNAIIFLSSFIFVALFLGFTLMDAHGYKDKVELVETPKDPAAAMAAPAAPVAPAASTPAAPAPTAVAPTK